ncbi:GreA/GreB family elongation factor [Marinomonas balearica]|uniref:GreA/GreB family elongation factor n=1 Tax=Marinomonas balearica TaxID=491947 RepID=UPI001FB618C1|nr:GreA/GreB family elongation factor [Marinomonas balearica]
METFRIVGPDELYHHSDYISIDSPVAKALLKKEEGDEVTIRRAEGEKLYYIDSVEYRSV